MISCPELSDFLEPPEKESVLRAISASDKIISSGVCQLLTVENGVWIHSQPAPAVALFLKNSSERYYKIILIEPSKETEWEPIVQFEHAFSEKHFETDQIHANLLVFESNHHEIGLNFYDSKECAKFHDSVCKRKSTKTTEIPSVAKLEKEETKKEKKKKKMSFFSNFFGSLHSNKEKKAMDIGSPTDFRHVDSVKMTEDQEDLYQQVMSKLKTTSEEEKEIVRHIVMTNENEFRKSMMVKKKSQTPKDVKERKEKKEKSGTSIWNRLSKAKIEDVAAPTPTVSTPVDPLNPDWSESTVIPSTVTVATSFKHSHTFAADPLKESVWTAPRKDTYGTVNQREPQNLYRFESEATEEHAERTIIEERPPELPSRSTSRHVQEVSLSAPRLPGHRGSYRWATQPETFSAISNSRQAEEYAEINLSAKTPTRSAPPPPPPSAPPIVAPSPSGPPPPAPPPLPPASVPLAPPLPPIITGGSVPQAPPPPILNSPLKLSAVPEISSDRRSLLEQIQSADKSKMLRKVSETPDTRQSVTSPVSGGTMIDQIQNFLDARRSGINPSDSEGSDDDDDDDDDDDWSD
ncbi:unnamed protein product [Caenorhabditis sp. 36 PRJEB53466]|nr:unnamed protein product [Caenorhabditis sp. 36 PRJEB53466]